MTTDPTLTPASNSPAPTPSANSPSPPPANDPAPPPAPSPAPPSPAPAPKGDEDLLLNPDKKPDAKPDDKKPVEKPPVADMKKFLEEKLGDKKSELEGKSDEDIAKLYDEQKAKDDAAAITFKLDELVLPDDMPVPDAIKDKVTTVANKHKLGKEAMQELTDIHIEMQRQTLKEWDNLKGEWRDKVKNDPTYGGAKLDDSVKNADAVVRKFAGNPEQLAEFSADLKSLGLGNKLSFVRLMNNIYDVTKDDTQQTNSGSPEEKLPPEKVLYPNMK